MKETITNNLRDLRGRIAEACEEHDRDADDITIMAVSKRFPARAVRTIVAAGIHDIGESRIQEADPKITQLGPIARFHMVGHLQTNKVRQAVILFDVIQSVDSIRLAEEINRRAGEVERTIECCIQVNTTGETQKNGVAVTGCLDLIREVNTMPNIKLIGLMTIGPFTDDDSEVRLAFARCRELFKQGRELIGNQFDTLSMGMTHDFALAIAEGSTMIRVGTGIFGPRDFVSSESA